MIRLAMGVGLLASASAGAAQAELKIVTDILPIHSIATQLAGDRAEIGLLLESAQDPHHVSLRPSQIRMLSEADIVLWSGPSIAPWLSEALNSLGNAPLVMALEDAKLPEDSHADHHDDNEDHHDHHGSHEEVHNHTEEHAHHDEHDHDEHKHEEHDHEEHKHDHHDHAKDAHRWFDPLAVQAWLPEISQALSQLDEAGAEQYAANSERYAEELTKLDQEIRAQLEPVHEKAFLVFHDAYGPLAARYDLNIAGALRRSDNTAASAARIQEITAIIEKEQPSCLFEESNHNPDIARQVANDFDLKLGILSPLGETEDAGADQYENLMRGLANSLVECLSDH